MTAFSFGLGASDWLKMKNPTKPTQPITQMGTMSNFGTAAPAIGAAVGASAPKPTAQPIAQTALAGASAGATVGATNPFAATDPAFNVPAPSTNAVSGLPIQPAGTPKTTQTAQVPMPMGVETPAAPAQVQTAQVPTPMGVEAPAAPASQSLAPSAIPTAPTPQPAVDPVSGLPIQPAGTPKTIQSLAPGAIPTGPTDTTAADAAAAAAANAPVSAPPKTEPSLDDNMATYEKIAMDWANGVVDDKVFRTTANRAILQMGLNNQAETDALQMRINQDPALKGQGAGAALLSIMAANQNFSADQMFGELAQSAQEKILDMQKYGLQQGIHVNQMRRENDYRKLGLLQDAGDFAGAAALAAKIADFPGVTISPSNFTASRARTSEDAQNLINAGNYEGAAAKLSQLTGTKVDAATLQMRDPFVWKQAQMLEDKGDFEGASKMYAANGLNISADDLRAQSPFQQTSWTNTLDGIKALASVNPAAATAQLDLLMKNPAAAKYLGFTAGMTAQDLINSIVTGKYQAEQQMRAGLQSEINLKAKSQVGFSQALVDYKAMGTQAWAGFTQDGKKMASGDLEGFNAARTALGMSEVHMDGQGNIVDAQNNMLMDDDFAESAAAADYASRKETMAKQPWQAAYENLMGPGSELRERILSIPGGEASVKESLQMLYLGGGYKLDPATQTMVPDYTGGMPWDNPSTKHIFHNWPLATFGADGTIEGKYDLGGEVYGDTVGDTMIQKMPDDEALEDAYSKYRYNNGALSAPEWYFATAGGTRPEDKTKIPADLKVADMTNPGTTTTPVTPTTPIKPGEVLTTGQVQNVNDYIASIDADIPSTVDKTKLTALVGEIGAMVPSSKIYTAIRDTLANKYPGASGTTRYQGKASGTDPNYINNNPNLYDKKPSSVSGYFEYTPTQKATDFYNFVRLTNLGMTEKQAYDIMVKTSSDARMKEAYSTFTGKEYSGG